MVLRKIRDNLMRRDAAIGRISERRIKDGSKRSKGSSKKSSKRLSKGSSSKRSSGSGSNRSMLTKPLIDDSDSDDEESDYEV